MTDVMGNPEAAPESGGFQAAQAHFGTMEPSTVPPSATRDIERLYEITVPASVEVGRTLMRIDELMRLQPGAVVTLDRIAEAPADVLVNGTLVGRGEIVVVDGRFGVRLTELVDPRARVKSLAG
ncbi:MAG: flagellar motor switch protein FliN [Planctomycetes bacterium]|nr:flagellar motor switch protein FliN [Planctomycetota bacterium]MBI3843029.1 flagellar motor switch protein FliN [Planctomycetota bacterium]